ncbi:MAG: hypothetical protein P8J37_23520 [Fuerstiella sp.]|nr:hypothetical protein [Fuerstiella sp.]
MTMFTRLSVFALLLLAIPAAKAHSSHTSITEVEWNDDSQRFEVAMKVRIADLQDAISVRQGKRIRVESEGAKNSILEYLTEKFSVTFAEADECRLRWVGLELELHDVWLYVEAEPLREHPSVAAQSAAPPKLETWDELFVVPDQRKSGFETTGRSGDRRVRIRDAVLCDVQPDQTNLVTIRVGGVTQSLVFEHEHDSATTNSAHARSKNKAQR